MGLKDLDDQYEKESLKDKPAFAPIPDGQYQAKLFALDVVNTKKEPVRPMLKLEFEIIGTGKFAKRRVWKNVMLTGDNIQYLKADLHALGWKHKLSDIEDVQKRATLLDRVVNIGLKTKGVDDKGNPRQNCFINSSQDRVGAGAPADAAKRASAGAVAAGGDDEPPF